MIDPLLGQQVGTYRVESLLGEGGMGRVYLATHPLLGRRAAIKVLLPEISTKAEMVERFFNEARAAAQLRHPGVVDVFDFGRLPDGSAYLIMEYLDGISLSARLRRLPMLSVNAALDIARQIAITLAAAHRQQIVHRDLKPDNLILLEDPELPSGVRAKLLDFGIAKLSSQSAGSVKTNTNAMLGTPVYMSPEQCRGAGFVDARSDIYSLGCVLFEMLTGRTPFPNTTMGDLIISHVTVPPPTVTSLRPELSAAIEQLVASMLVKRPEERVQSMDEVAQVIDGMLMLRSGDRVRGAELALDRVGELRAEATQVTPSPALSPSSPPPAAHMTTLAGSAGSRSVEQSERRASGRWPIYAGAAVGLVTLAVAAALSMTRGVPDASVPASAPSARPIPEEPAARTEIAPPPPRAPVATPAPVAVPTPVAAPAITPPPPAPVAAPTEAAPAPPTTPTATTAAPPKSKAPRPSRAAAPRSRSSKDSVANPFE